MLFMQNVHKGREEIHLRNIRQARFGIFLAALAHPALGLQREMLPHSEVALSADFAVAVQFRVAEDSADLLLRLEHFPVLDDEFCGSGTQPFDEGRLQLLAHSLVKGGGG